MTCVSNRHVNRGVAVILTALLWLCMMAALVYTAGLSMAAMTCGRWVLGLYVSSLCTTWLFLAHMMASFLLRLLVRNGPSEHTRDVSSQDQVAVLMCTRDDWLPDVAEWCLTTLRESDHLFVCDD